MARPRLGRAEVRVAASVWALELIPVLVRWTARPSPGRCLRVPLPFEYVHQIGMSDDLGPNLAGRGVVADQSVLNDGDLPGRVLVAVPAHEGVVDPAAFVQTAKPGGGMGGTPKLRRLPSGAGVSGGGGVVSGGRGFGCWWRRLGCRVRRRGVLGVVPRFRRCGFRRWLETPTRFCCRLRRLGVWTRRAWRLVTTGDDYAMSPASVQIEIQSTNQTLKGQSKGDNQHP